MISKPDRKKQREKRRIRVRKKITGTGERPRLNVFRSLNNIYASLIDDEKGVTVVTVSTLSQDVKGKFPSGGNKEAAALVGKLVAKEAQDKGIKKVVFDRAGYIYHGRIKALADAAREGGLEF